MIQINKDSFSSGQIGSKLWLCEELERLGWNSRLTWIYGGWYATTAFLLRARGRFQVRRIESFDLDPECAPMANLVNNNWERGGGFKAYTQDCNEIKDVRADLIINTSVEHFEQDLWWKNLPNGVRVILQSNNMPHEDHVSQVNSVDEFLAAYPISRVDYSGSLSFQYPTWGFTRFMIIGVK